MSYEPKHDGLAEKHATDAPGYEGSDPENNGIQVAKVNALHKDLKGRHMQMIAM
jgi:amino acid permease